MPIEIIHGMALLKLAKDGVGKLVALQKAAVA